MKGLIPKKYNKNIFTINYDELKKNNIKYLVFDLDNTLGLIDDEFVSEETKNFLNKLSDQFTIIVASNNKQKRVLKFISGIKTDILSFALKPSGKIYRYLKKKYTKNMQEVAIIGDQIVTDILAGNRFGMMTILVDPLGKKDLKITNINRFIEKKIMKKINFKRGSYYEKK